MLTRPVFASTFRDVRPDPIPATFRPDRLTEARGEHSLEWVAVAVGCSKETVRRWEAGTHEPDASALKKISEATGRELDFFFVAGGGIRAEEAI